MYHTVHLKYKSVIFSVSGSLKEELLLLASSKRQNTNVEFISKVLCVYFGSSLIVRHSTPLKYRDKKNVFTLFSTHASFKSTTV